MKLKHNFELRVVCGENVVIPRGVENINFDRIIHFNETGAFLWKEAQKGDFTLEQLAEALLKEFGDGSADDPQICQKDAAEFVATLKEQGLVVES